MSQNGAEVNSRAGHGEWRALIDGDSNVYTKGPMVIQMLRYLFFLQQGEDGKFWDFLRVFLRDNRYREVSTQDFISLAEDHLGGEIPWFWDQWIYGTKIPQVRWSYSVEPGEEGWLLTVEAKQLGSDYTLMIPVDLHFKGEGRLHRTLMLIGASGSLQLMLPEKPQSVRLNEGHHSLVVLKN